MSQAGSGAALRLNKVIKVYDGSEEAAVDCVDLDVREGEFLTLLGPSGSGKTTTLNMIAGFVIPTAGDIELDHQQVAPLPPHRRNIGVVFQNYALFPHMTAAGNVAFPLKQRKMRKAEIGKSVKEALRLVEMGAFGARYPRELSGGQQQRVALARALVFRPRLVVMDEPLGALDRKLREALQHEIKAIHEEVGTTFVYVTHDQEEALVMSDRIAVFNEGRIEQIGTPRSLYEHPASTFVARFLGESNVLDGIVEEDGVRCGAFKAAVPVGGFEDGERVALVVRPEDVRITVPPDDGERCGVATGTIAACSYLGASVRVEIVIDGGTRIISRVDGATGAACSVGASVEIDGSLEKCIVLTEAGQDHAVAV